MLILFERALVCLLYGATLNTSRIWVVIPFIETIQRKLSDASQGDLNEVSRLQRRPLDRPLQWYENNEPDRKRSMALAYASGHYSMKEFTL